MFQASSLAHDRFLKARIVLNHPALYSEAQVSWAEGVLAGDERVLAQPDRLHIIPEFAPKPAPASPAGEEEKGAGKLRVLFFMYGWAESGGGTILPRQIARALARRGHRVAVVYAAAEVRPGWPPYHVEEREEDGVRLFAVYNRPALFWDPEHPEREAEDPEIRAIVRRLLADLRPDIVHYHSFLGFSMAMAEEVRAAGVPSVYTSHNYWPLCPRLYLFRSDLSLCPGPSEDGSRCAACTGRLERQFAYGHRAVRGRLLLNRLVDRHLAVSHRVRELFVQNGHDASRIYVLHQVPEPADWIWQQVGAHRPPEGPLERPLRVGFIGSLMAHKGPHVLVSAAQAFRPEEVEVHLFGEAVEHYRQYLQELDTAGLAKIHGRYDLSRLPEILRGVDVVAVPSVWEDCAPLVVEEALAARCPVVASRIGGIPDFVQDGVNGLLCKAGDPQDLARALRRFLDDPALLGRLQANIDRSRNFDAFLDDLVGHYLDVIRLHGRRAEGSGRRPSGVLPEGRESFVIKWEGSQFVHHSLALINRELCLQLIKDGHEVSILPYEPDEFGPEADDRFRHLQVRVRAALSRPADVHVRHQWPPNLTPPEEGHWVVIQPWEYGTLPRGCVEVMSSQVDEVWVPTNYVRNCYILSGVPADRVHVVPNGVDPARFHPAAPPLRLPEFEAAGGQFRFLFVGGTVFRKGIDLVLKAYLQAFTRADDVCLVIKDVGLQTAYHGRTMEPVIREILADREAPRIVYLDRDMPPGELPGLYTACHCLVHPYRGEGFGLPIAEAMACGLPVIVTAYGAALDFCDTETAHLLPATILRTAMELTSEHMVPVGDTWFAEPDLAVLVRWMRHVYENPEEARLKGAVASERIRSSFTWARSAEAAVARIRVLTRQPIRRHTVQVVPAKPWTKGTALAMTETRAVHLLLMPDWHDPEDAWPQALREFLRTFGQHEDVGLLIRLDPLECPHQEAALRRLTEWAASEGVDLEAGPMILVVNDLLLPTRRDLLYRAAHVLVNTSATGRGRAIRAEAAERGLLVCRPLGAEMRAAFETVVAARREEGSLAAR